MILILTLISIILGILLTIQIAVNSDLRASRDNYREQLKGKCFEHIPVIGTKRVTEDDVLHAKHDDLPDLSEVIRPASPRGNSGRKFTHEPAKPF